MPPTRSLTFLNESGDVIIGWDESTDDKMLELIKKKMSEGMVFFIVKPRILNMLPPMKEELKNPYEAFINRHITVHDDDFQQLIAQGAAATFKRAEVKQTGKKPSIIEQGIKMAKSATEVVQNHTVGVRPRAGG